MQVGDLFDPVLQDYMAICHFKGVGVAYIDFFLARTPFTLGIFDRDVGAFQTVADGAHNPFLFRGLEDVVILNVPAGCFQVAIVLFVGALETFIKQVEFQLGCHECGQVAFGQPL